MRVAKLTLGAGVLAFAVAASQQAVAPLPPPFAAEVQPGRTLATGDMVNPKPLIPIDIYRNPNNSVDHADLATFAWLSFISAASIAGSRGVPDASFAESGKASSSPPLVWETYQHRTELLPCNKSNGVGGPTPPQPWGAAPKYVIAPKDSSSCTTLPAGLPFNNLDEGTQIGQNNLFYPVDPAAPNPAVDWQVLFEARVNQLESDWARANYSSLIPASSKPFHFAPGFKLPSGTVEVKAAWRPIESIPAEQRYRYHTANVVTYVGTDENPKPVTHVYALIALHLIHKTPNYPTFIFATFEQVDDLKNQATGQPTGVYYVPTYNNVHYTIAAQTTFPPSGEVVNNPDIHFLVNAPTANPLGGGTVNLPLGPVGGPKPGQARPIRVQQPVPPVPEVAKVNQQALAAMRGIPGFNQNFVWQYYRLAGVQSIPTSDETVRDFYLANIVVESSQPGIQLFRGGVALSASPIQLTNLRNEVNVVDYHFNGGARVAMGGCQGCHGNAQTQIGSDFSFLYAGAAGSGFAPEVLGIVPEAVAQARLKARKY